MELKKIETLKYIKCASQQMRCRRKKFYVWKTKIKYFRKKLYHHKLLNNYWNAQCPLKHSNWPIYKHWIKYYFFNFFFTLTRILFRWHIKNTMIHGFTDQKSHIKYISHIKDRYLIVFSLISSLQHFFESHFHLLDIKTSINIIIHYPEIL